MNGSQTIIGSELNGRMVGRLRLDVAPDTHKEGPTYTEQMIILIEAAAAASALPFNILPPSLDRAAHAS